MDDDNLKTQINDLLALPSSGVAQARQVVEETARAIAASSQRGLLSTLLDTNA